MGSPVTLSGFNKIDFNVVLNAIMQQERIPLNNLETKKRGLESANTALTTLDGKLETLLKAADALKASDSLSVLRASSSDEMAVGVSSSGGTVSGTYDLVVTELARAQVLSSTSSYASLDDVVTTSGTLTITPGSGAATVITASSPMTLRDLVNAINGDSEGKVAATAVQVAPGSYKLVLTAKSTGAANGFTVTSSLAGGAGVTFTDTDGDNTFGDSAEDNTQTARDAALTVNGLAVSSASNTVSNVIPGVTLTLKKKDPATTITVDVSKDLDGAKKVVKDLVTAYNALVTFTKDQQTASVAGKPSLAKDPVLRGLRDAVSSVFRAQHAVGGSFTRLAEVGVGFDHSGNLTLDEKLFEEKLGSAAADVQKLFGGASGDAGAFGALAAQVKEYSQSNGFIDLAKTRNTEQASAISRRLDALETQLTLRRQVLQREMIAADMAMTRLNSQSGQLQRLGGGFGAF